MLEPHVHRSEQIQVIWGVFSALRHLEWPKMGIQLAKWPKGIISKCKETTGQTGPLCLYHCSALYFPVLTPIMGHSGTLLLPTIAMVDIARRCGEFAQLVKRSILPQTSTLMARLLGS